MLARSASTAALSNPLEQAGPQSSNPATAGDSGVEQPLAATLSQEDSAQEQMDDMQEDAPQAHAQHAQPAPILLGADLAERPSVGQPPVPNQHSARGPNSSAVLQPRPHAGSPMRLAADRQMSATHEPPDQSNPPAPGLSALFESCPRLACHLGFQLSPAGKQACAEGSCHTVTLLDDCMPFGDS